MLLKDLKIGDKLVYIGPPFSKRGFEVTITDMDDTLLAYSKDPFLPDELIFNVDLYKVFGYVLDKHGIN